MSYCLNPNCKRPDGPMSGARFCQYCGSSLLLKDRYRAIELLGAGGFGRTFLAIDDHRLGSRCVIKQLFPQTGTDRTLQEGALEQAVRLFEQEAMRLDELGEHSQIPTLLAYFEEHGQLYLIQQYIDGKTLLQDLEAGQKFGEKEIRELLLDLLPILKFVHDRQVIHRDIKPSNILRREGDNRFVLIDFGIAKQGDPDSEILSGTRVGTNGYAPMEQWRSGKVFPASDLYSLGATCLFLMTRTKPETLFDPFEGRWQWREQLTELGVQITPQLEYILTKLLKDVVSERYQSADEVLRDLQMLPMVERSHRVVVPEKVPVLTILGNQPIPQIWVQAYQLPHHIDRVRCLAIHPSGRLFASGSNDKTICLWNLSDGQLTNVLKDHTEPIHAIAISPSGQYLASGSGDKTIKVWTVSTGQLIYTLKEHTNWVNALAISPDGLFLVSAGEDKTIKVWNLAQGTLLKSWKAHHDPIYALAISPDSRIVVSAGGDRVINQWNLETGDLLSTLTGYSSRINTLAISLDGQLLVSGSSEGIVRLWQLSTGNCVNSLTDHVEGVLSVAIGPDSHNPGRQILVSGSRDHSIKLWEPTMGRLLGTISEHTGQVNAVAISPDGRTLVSGGTDKLIRAWRVST